MGAVAADECIAEARALDGIDAGEGVDTDLRRGAHRREGLAGREIDRDRVEGAGSVSSPARPSNVKPPPPRPNAALDAPVATKVSLSCDPRVWSTPVKVSVSMPKPVAAPAPLVFERLFVHVTVAHGPLPGAPPKLLLLNADQPMPGVRHSACPFRLASAAVWRHARSVPRGAGWSRLRPPGFAVATL